MKLRRNLGSLLIILIAAVAALWVVTNRQAVIDHIVVWQFHPNAQVADLATESGMNANGQFLYYASRPEIDDHTTFNAACPNSESQAAILGCYTNYRIYVYNVTDSRVANVKIVTAAHEMLHAAYARLSDSDKKYVDGLIEAEYQKIKNLPDIASAMSVYATTEPGEADNELHSIIGTEVGNISPALEKYYTRYFSDRSKVVAAYQSYESVFTDIQNQAKQLRAQLSSLKTQIDTASATYTANINQLQADITTFNQRAQIEGGFSSQASFNQQRSALESRVASLSAERDSINQMIAQYNSIVQQLNMVATENQSLNQSINSSLPAAPQLQ